MFLKKIYDLVFAGRKRPIQEMVTDVFPEKDQSFARSFYQSWHGEEFLLVDIGDGYHGLEDKGRFFHAALFNFYALPFDVGDDWFLGAHAEDDLGSIVLDKDTGKIHYAYENSHVIELAEDFPSFITALRKAGWRGPQRYLDAR